MSLSFVVNIDVPDLASGTRFYTQGLGLRVGRKFAEPWVELLGGAATIYLLEKPAGSAPASHTQARSYERHWTPVHLDFVVSDIDSAIANAVAAGATVEQPSQEQPYGKLALLADPFGNGFCFLQFNAEGYDAPALHQKPAS